MATATAWAFPPEREDPLAYLPRGTMAAYRRKEHIYSQNQPSLGLYLILDGRVKVSRFTGNGREVVVDIYRDADFFGESGLLGLLPGPDVATALDRTKVMSWTATQIEDLVVREPGLAVTLWRILVRRILDLSSRIESFSTDDVSRRLARSLIRFSERLGTRSGNGMIEMVPLPHHLLAGYVGTSREMVSCGMSDFRLRGCLRYSRRGITLDRERTMRWLCQDTADGGLRMMAGQDWNGKSIQRAQQR